MAPKKINQKTRFELSVVAPCYNEEGNLNALVKRVDAVFKMSKLKGEIVLVNDGSSDNSKKAMSKLAHKFTNLNCIHHKKNQGIELAWKSGVENSRGEYVCLIDADLQNLPEDIWRLYREIVHSRVDLIQGYRSSIGRLKDSRYFLSRSLNNILNLIFSMSLQDNKSGFVCAPQETLLDILNHSFSYHYFQSFVAVSAHYKGYIIREIETLFQDRNVGKSFISNAPYKVILKSLVDILKAYFEFRFIKRYDSVLLNFLKDHPINKDKEKAGYLKGWRRLLMRMFVFTMPLHKWMIGRNAYLYYKELQKSQWLKPDEIEQLQELKLKRLILHAYNHVGYYRQKMDELGVKPYDIKTLEDLNKLPLLTKDIVRKNLYFDLLSDTHDKKKILKITTSGSTGEPFICYADKHQLEMRWAATLRGQEWAGYRFGDRQARLWHQTLGMSYSQVIREKLDAWLTRRLFVPAFELDNKKIRTFAKKLERYRPKFIDGYAESFNFIARFLSESKINLQVKSIMTSAQVLPEQSREVIEKTFQCGVFDKYGSREFSGIAYECDLHDGHHIVAENYIVEILKNGKPAKPGEMGEVVITDLNNLCFPFIRYRIGDLAVAMDHKKVCGCGRGLPKVGKIEGRIQAIILGSNGAYIPGTFFSHFFKEYEYAIRQYQIIQSKKNEVTLKIIKADQFNETVLQKILQELKNYLGKDMKIKVEFTNYIPMVRTGKHQVSVSKLKLDFQKET